MDIGVEFGGKDLDRILKISLNNELYFVAGENSGNLFHDIAY